MFQAKISQNDLERSLNDLERQQRINNMILINSSKLVHEYIVYL